MDRLKREDLFYAAFLAAIFMTRFFLFLHPIHSPIIGDFHMHHYMYGIILIGIGIATRSPIIYGVGAGLFMDELLLLRNINQLAWSDYFAPASFIKVMALIAAVFYLRKYLTIPLERHYKSKHHPRPRRA